MELHQGHGQIDPGLACPLEVQDDRVLTGEVLAQVALRLRRTRPPRGPSTGSMTATLLTTTSSTPRTDPSSMIWDCVEHAYPLRDRRLASRYGRRVPPELRVEPIAKEQMDALLPLIAAYQRFYEVEEIDEERNRSFFSRFLSPSDDGLLLGAWRGGHIARLRLPLLELHFAGASQDRATERSLRRPHDTRGEGVGRALIEASAAAGRERGAQRLEWVTQTATRPPSASMTRLAPRNRPGSSTSSRSRPQL